MKLTRRAFNRGGAAVAAVAMLPGRARATVPPRDEALVLARATDIDLSAQETAVVLAPVPPPRRPPQKPKRAKGEKPAASRTWIVLRDVVAADRTPAYDLFLVLEGTNVFAPTTTTQPVGALELLRHKAGGDDGSRAQRVHCLRRYRGVGEAFEDPRLQHALPAPHDRAAAVTDTSGNETVPGDPTPPEIGTIELVRW